MQTTMQPTNYPLFIAHLLMAALVGLLGAYLADGQVIDGDLTYWTADDHAGIPDAYSSPGIALLNGSTPVAIFQSREFHVCWFDGDCWHATDLIWGLCTDMAQGPDGKVWLTSWDNYSQPTGVAFMEDVDAIHQTDCDWWSYHTFALDIAYWQGVAYMIFGTYLSTYAEYCKPSSDELRSLGDLPLGQSIGFDASRSGDFLASVRYGNPLWIQNLRHGGVWELTEDEHRTDPGDDWRKSPLYDVAGMKGYFWATDLDRALIQIDAETSSISEVTWAEDQLITCMHTNWRGLWIFGRQSASDETSPLFVALWSFLGPELDDTTIIPLSAGISPRGGWARKFMTTHAVRDELWLTTKKAVYRWTPENIPMPYEARVENEAKESGTVEVAIEFDNRRIIRNDATLRLNIEHFADGQDEPLPGTLTFDVYYEFQPQETFTYSFDHTPEAPPGVDKVRYSVYTTCIDVHAPPTDEETVTSNVATAEVRLD